MKKKDIKITKRIKTYEDACKVLGIQPIDEQKFIELGFRLAEIAKRKIETITEALNEGWTADYDLRDQCKFIPWFSFSPSGFAFCPAGYRYSITAAGGGSSLCFRTSELAEYSGKQFAELYKVSLS